MERETTRHYFYSWDMAYRAFCKVSSDNITGYKGQFVSTAELLSSDKDIGILASSAVSFGDLFEKLVAFIIYGNENNNPLPPSWKNKTKSAVYDVHIAVERTLLVKEIAFYYQHHIDSLKSQTIEQYLTIRKAKSFLPFSDEACNLIKSENEIPYKEKILYEKMYLIMEAVRKGIFYGFWDVINEIDGNELLSDEVLNESAMKEVSFTYINKSLDSFNNSWLYRIHFDGGYLYFMGHKKVMTIESNNAKSTLSGIIYPSVDRGLFKDY